ncbi:MAG: hypothetical protein QOJ86_865 [Bradyrhizobium sp.]|nr:hypothetical protein [Bradyrhizobium sp.]
MGEAKLKKSATQKFIEQYPHCALCGGERPSATREHMPPKSLFDQSYRPDRLVMPACVICNGGTSKADLTAAMVSRWNYNSPHQEQADHSRLANQVRIQAPELIAEWTKLDQFDRKGALDHLRRYGVSVPDDAGLVAVGRHTIKQLNIFAHKAALCLYFEHFKKPLPNSGRVSAHFRTKEDFSNGGLPPELLEILPKYGTMMQGKWNSAETFEYRYDLNEKDGLFGCLARLRTGLFVAGFAIPDAELMTEEFGNDWIRPIELLTDPEHFSKKN